MVALTTQETYSTMKQIKIGHKFIGQNEQALTTPAGLGAQSFESALATTIEPPPRETSGLPVIRAESFRYDPADGDVMVKISASNGASRLVRLEAEVAIDDPLALLAVTMAAIKFGHGPEMLAAAQKLVADFGKEPTR